MILRHFVHVATSRPPYTVSDVFRRFGAAYREKYPVTAEQEAVIGDMVVCRTAALGGHLEQCDECGKVVLSYNSCGNRHCNQCGAFGRAKWLEKQKKLLLPVPYFQAVFTTDHGLNPLFRSNPRVMYDLLFESATASLKEVAGEYLGGELGITAVLHTWGQRLEEHVHLHCVVTGGVLSFDGQRWIAGRADFLLPVVKLSQVYRQKLCAGVRRLLRRGKLVLVGTAAELDVERMVREIEGKDWQVYLERPVAGTEKVLGYLGRYVNRVALANERIVKIEGENVYFRYEDNRDGGKEKVQRLSGVEFMRRYLSHILPEQYRRIRYYGLHQNGQRRKLARCRELLEAKEWAERRLRVEEWWLEMTGEVVGVCPWCGEGRLVNRRKVERPGGWLMLLLSLLGVAIGGRVVYGRG
jgi:hypothetical protein